MLVSIGSRAGLLLFDRRITLAVRVPKRFIQLGFFLENTFGWKGDLVTVQLLNPDIGPPILREVEYVALDPRVSAALATAVQECERLGEQKLRIPLAGRRNPSAQPAAARATNAIARERVRRTVKRLSAGRNAAGRTESRKRSRPHRQIDRPDTWAPDR